MTSGVIPLFKPHIPLSAAAALQEVLESGQIAGDGRLSDLEGSLMALTAAPHLALTAEFSRTVEMALRLVGVQPGDAVLLSPLACLATTMPILQAGAVPVWCDIDPSTGGIDPEDVRRKRVPRAKAVLLYHWVGVPADIAGVRRVSQELELKVVEDAGEALGAAYGGDPVGSHQFDCTVFSFSPARHLTMGEGAALVCPDAAMDSRARLQRRYGIPDTGFRDDRGELSATCDIQEAGTHNYMNRLSAALGREQMRCAEAVLGRYRSNGEFYDGALAEIDGIRLLSRDDGRVPSHWVYCFACERRDDLLEALRASGISASRVHIRNDIYSAFGTGQVDLAQVAEFERTQLCIPSGWWVTDEDREYIADTIRRGW